MATGGHRKHLSGEGENRYRNRKQTPNKPLLTMVVMKFSVFNDIQYCFRGGIDRVGTSYRTFWKVEGEEHFWRLRWGWGEKAMGGMVLLLQTVYGRSRARAPYKEDHPFCGI